MDNDLKLKLHNPVLWEELNNVDHYRPFFKNSCITCKTKIEKGWYHYSKFGNFCQDCNNKAGERSKLKFKPI